MESYNKFIQFFSLTTLLLISLSIQSCQSTPQGLPVSPIQSRSCSRNEDCSMFPDSDCRNRIFCQCQKGFVDDMGKCLPIRLDLESECEQNAQCAQGLGDLSRCSTDSKKCECFDTRGNGANSTAFYKAYCYYRKELGQHCQLAEECKSSINPPEDVTCSVPSRTCVCQEGKTCENVPGAAASFVKSVTLLLIAFTATKIIF